MLTQLGAFNDMSNPRDVVTPPPLKDAVVNEIPGVVRSCRCKLVSTTLEYNSSLFAEQGFLYADPELFEMFSFPVISGNPSEALKEPFSLFVTSRMAKKYFGNEDPIGKTIKASNKYAFTVKGVIEDIPLNSHFNFDFLTGFQTLYQTSGGRDKVEGWANFNNLTYIQLSENSNPDSILVDFAGIAERHIPKAPLFKNMKWVLQPLRKIHLGGQNGFDTVNQSDMRYVFLTASIGILIFLIACINYMNMAIAGSFSRGREIGIIKVTGSSRTEIVFRLMAEPLMVSFGGLILAMGLISFMLPVFAGFTDRPLTYRMLFGNSMPWLVLALTFLMGALAGLLPALSLSSFNPLRLIKEEFTDISGKRKSVFLKNVLLVIQYTISIIALVSAFAMKGQLKYMKNKDQGFLSRNIITIAIKDPEIRKNPVFLINEIRNNPKISGVSASSYLPHSITSIGLGAWEGKTTESLSKVFRLETDNEFLDFYNIKLVSGRGFSNEFRDDSLNNYLINEAAARLLGRADPVGMKFGFERQSMGTIIGIVKDFNFQSLRLQVEPLAISAIQAKKFPETHFISVKVKDGDIEEIKLFLTKLLKQASPAYLNPVSVLSESIESMYVSDRRLAVMIMFSTVIALVLTCLGQYSLSFYTAQKRTKEMAVRKVFGATPASVMSIFSRETIKLILVALAIAWPLSFLIMNRWLQHYAFRTELKPSFFIYSMLITVLSSIAVIAFNVHKLARVNPAETIRYE